MLRPIKSIPLIGIEPQPIGSQPPTFDRVRPGDLLIEAEYQRNLTKRSITLIRKIAEGFCWLHIKPPVCAKGGDGKLCVVDGQHTAIAAASRGVDKIPVMIVEAPEIERRARAFVAHNTDRLAVTPLQLFASRLAAGDASAKVADKAARLAGVTICRSQPANGSWEVGHTVAIAGLERLVARLGEEKGAQGAQDARGGQARPCSRARGARRCGCALQPEIGLVAFGLRSGYRDPKQVHRRMAPSGNGPHENER